MKTTKYLKALMVLAGVLFLLFYPVSSKAIPFSFVNITNNPPGGVNVASQLSVDVTGSGSSATFKFYDIGSIQSFIGAIYFDDGAIMGSTLSITTSGVDVAYQKGGSPGDLPGGNSIIPKFDVTNTFYATVLDQGLNGTGVNNYPGSYPPYPGGAEWVAITFALVGTNTFNDVLEDLADGSLRIGLHVQSIGTTEKSDSFVNTVPVPEPGILILLGVAMSAIGMASWRISKI